MQGYCDFENIYYHFSTFHYYLESMEKKTCPKWKRWGNILIAYKVEEMETKFEEHEIKHPLRTHGEEYFITIIRWFNYG